MYEQDLKKIYSIDVDLYPSVDYIQLASGVQPTTGFTFAVRLLPRQHTLVLFWAKDGQEVSKNDAKRRF